MLIDEVQLHIKAGHGGAGKVCFDTVPRSLGPTGGNGGNGGSVYAEGVSDLAALRQYRYKKDFSAEDGGRGAEAKRAGRAGNDFVLKVPIGTIIRAKLKTLMSLKVQRAPVESIRVYAKKFLRSRKSVRRF